MFFFFKQKTAYEIMPSLVGSEMCIRDRYMGIYKGNKIALDQFGQKCNFAFLNNQINIEHETEAIWFLQEYHIFVDFENLIQNGEVCNLYLNFYNENKQQLFWTWMQLYGINQQQKSGWIRKKSFLPKIQQPPIIDEKLLPVSQHQIIAYLEIPKILEIMEQEQELSNESFCNL
eukprot:TRINITY_DN17038_c0_g1_i1.p2 TRINITY_DN17038_c0_g1~~TRINITY_DN17038_c0_g1_i1.p2  ORF type:complete len:174 (+),score=39.00 TRINITY_DN17038_c0_g1_i1:33-554(+)